jgi:hypothetical protein
MGHDPKLCNHNYVTPTALPVVTAIQSDLLSEKYKRCQNRYYFSRFAISDHWDSFSNASAPSRKPAAALSMAVGYSSFCIRYYQPAESMQSGSLVPIDPFVGRSKVFLRALATDPGEKKKKGGPPTWTAPFKSHIIYLYRRYLSSDRASCGA